MQREDFEQQLTALLRGAGPDRTRQLPTGTGEAGLRGCQREGTGALAGDFELHARRWKGWLAGANLNGGHVIYPARHKWPGAGKCVCSALRRAGARCARWTRGPAD